MSRILLVEDDKSIIESLKEFLETSSYEVVNVDSQYDAQMLLERESFDLALLDIMLRMGSGIEVCKTAKSKNVPVIFLTASSDENSIVDGLDMGADDYIPKPFRPRELLSRIKNVLRRYTSSSVVTIQNLSVDTERGVVSKNGIDIDLSALEYRLFIHFLNNRGRLLSRNMLLENIWDIAGDFVNDNTLTVYIKRLREKIEDDPQNPVIITTVRGRGYRMD